METKVVVNRGLDGKFQKITESLEEFGQIYATDFATQLALYSPSDTGTYLDNFYAGPSGTEGTTSSHGKPRNQPWDGQKAVNRMSQGIAAMRGSTQMVFGNRADHVYQVEYEHGYRPFGKASEMHSTIVRNAWAKANG